MTRRRAIGRIHLDRGLPLPDRAVIEHPDAPERPAISIITATYNRSNVLGLLIECIRAQTFTDWEMVIIGDRCTDDTEDVIGRFDDPRIRYFDLEQNFGEQSGPNSIGARLARGRYLAWINHDELLYSDHLERLHDALITTPAEVALSSLLIIGPGRASSSPRPEESVTPMRIVRIDRSRGTRALLHQPASSWLLDAALVREVGDWRSANELRAQSSFHYLHRCWMTGARFAHTQAATLVAIQSGRFTDSYRDRRQQEHVDLAVDVIGWRSEERPFPRPIADVTTGSPRRRNVRRLVSTPIVAALARVGVAPSEVLAVARRRRPGEFIRRLRARRGLEESG